jgi:hypothetical protein
VEIIQQCLCSSWDKRPSIQDLLLFLESFNQQHHHHHSKDLEILKLKEIIKEQNELIEKLKLEIKNK